MKQEDKELLLKDLCARLPYGVMVNAQYKDGEGWKTEDRKILGLYENGQVYLDCVYTTIDCIKSYLRPLSSMTEKEKEELLNLLFDKEAKYFYINEEGVIDGKTSDLMKEGLNYPAFCPINIVLYINWLNSHHFDYRNLIEKNLALEAPEDMYNIKEK